MKLAAPLVLAALALGVLLFGLHASLGLAVPLLPDADIHAEGEVVDAVSLDDAERPVLFDAAAPVAVVELFTSEGCSSCPPADRLLLDFADRDDDRLFPLAFHVDYWNRLGWRDPFSDEAYSQRQRAYARTTSSGRVYTPQMIVNGQREFVGSRRAEAEKALQQALRTPAAATVDLSAALDGRTVHVDYAVEGAPSDAMLHLVLVQRRAEVDVPRGENAGRTLRHANVVRVFETVASGSGAQALTLPSGLGADAVALVGYVQLPTMEIVGASRLSLLGG